MKNLRIVLSIISLFGLSSIVQAGNHKDKHSSQDIVETANSAGSFNTLATALTEAGLIEALKAEGPFTVFAPTDEAFKKLPEGTLNTLLKPENKEKLVSILTYHVVPGKIKAKQVTALDSAKTLQGNSVSIKTKNGKVYVDNAQVIKTDIMASNGIIHVIDSVILPE